MLSRARAIEEIAGQRFEVVVIGGGITGAGVALDAASRGYSVALLERGDYALGTSSRSSKMVHGGLRYLQNFDLGLVREALLERQLMVQLALEQRLADQPEVEVLQVACLLYTSPSPRDLSTSRMPSSA